MAAARGMLCGSLCPTSWYMFGFCGYLCGDYFHAHTKQQQPLLSASPPLPLYQPCNCPVCVYDDVDGSSCETNKTSPTMDECPIPESKIHPLPQQHCERCDIALCTCNILPHDRRGDIVPLTILLLHNLL